MSNIRFAIFLALFVSCQNTSEDNQETMNHPKREISQIYKEITQGDTAAYLELRNIYLDNFSGDFLYWALFMSNKYKYSKAYYDVFEILVTTYVGEIEKIDDMDEDTRKLAIGYLITASKEGSNEARRVLAKIESEK